MNPLVPRSLLPSLFVALFLAACAPAVAPIPTGLPIATRIYIVTVTPPPIPTSSGPPPVRPAPTVPPSETPAPLLPPAPTDPAFPPGVTTLPPALDAHWARVADGFNRPVALAHAGDERRFVVEQAGRIWILSPDGPPLPTPFLDIRDRVGSSANEQGLFSMAFPPDFTASGRFYVHYTDLRGDTVLARFALSPDPDRADPASEEILLTADQPFSNHNGGQLAFGPDGYLYMGLGDGGSFGDPFGNAQRVNTLLGKLLRLDVSGDTGYAIPPDNPDLGRNARREIWAYGLRNPWRFSFDRASGDL